MKNLSVRKLADLPNSSILQKWEKKKLNQRDVLEVEKINFGWSNYEKRTFIRSSNHLGGN